MMQAHYLVQILAYEWGQSVSNFLNYSKVVMTRDENGLETQSIVSFWEASQGLWIESWKYEYDYNTDDNLLWKLNLCGMATHQIGCIPGKQIILTTRIRT